MVSPVRGGGWDDVLDAQDHEAPLLSDEGKKFLDGEIDAERYVTSIRHIEALRAKVELDRYLEVRRRRLRLVIITFLIFVALPYAALGALTFASKENTVVGAVASATAGIAALLAVGYARLPNEAFDKMAQAIRKFLVFYHQRGPTQPKS